ncbi:MAG: hypothetical protein LUD50_01130, partial [Clostridia bacterium]|nr:hypothetical protein [Clostridia bacterium]
PAPHLRHTSSTPAAAPAAQPAAYLQPLLQHTCSFTRGLHTANTRTYAPLSGRLHKHPQPLRTASCAVPRPHMSPSGDSYKP